MFMGRNALSFGQVDESCVTTASAYRCRGLQRALALQRIDRAGSSQHRRAECVAPRRGELWRARHGDARAIRAAEGQSSVSTRTSLWSWLLPTQNVTGVVELSTNTVRMLVSPGIRYCTAVPVFGSTRTTRSVYMVEAHNSPFLSKLARYG